MTPAGLLRAADDKGKAADDYRELASAIDAGPEVVLETDEPVEARYLLLWLTSLPADGADFRGGIREVVVTG